MRITGLKTPGSARRLAAATGSLVVMVVAFAGTSGPAEALTTPVLATFASGTIAVGGTITDTALLGQGSSPTGTIVFKIYGPGDTKCTNAPAFTSPAVKLAVPTVSPPYQATVPGTYQVIATYSGDVNNAAVTGACGAIAESVVVTPATPTLTTAAQPVTAGGTISDTAVLTGGFKPTGTITFHAYGPNDAACATPVFSSTAAAGISTTSGAYHPPAVGVYRWIAQYSGDSNNATVLGSCSDPAEAVTVAAGTGTTGPAGTPQAACTPAVAQALANSVLAALTSALTGGPAVGFNSSCSAGLRIVLRAKEIRPGNKGSPRHDGYTTMANSLTHTTTTGQLGFSLNAQGAALKAYTQSTGQHLTAFAIVHVRPDHTLVSSEALQILTLG